MQLHFKVKKRTVNRGSLRAELLSTLKGKENGGKSEKRNIVVPGYNRMPAAWVK